MKAGIIKLNGVKAFAHHGCLEEEAAIGQDYIVDVVLHCNFIDAAREDALKKTIDYVKVNKIVEEEMAIRSKLIEHVGHRILTRLKSSFSILDKAVVTVTKINPPINGHVRDVSVTLEG